MPKQLTKFKDTVIWEICKFAFEAHPKKIDSFWHLTPNLIAKMYLEEWIQYMDTKRWASNKGYPWDLAYYQYRVKQNTII